MNIHFSDRSLFDQLCASTVARVRVGSHTYGLEDAESDVDTFYVYAPSKTERNSFTFTHHQLQYKDGGADHIFANVFTFIRNTLNGDSVLNFEAIHNPALATTPLGFLYEMRDAFVNIKVIRAYLGLARRDLKQIGNAADTRSKNKRLIHAHRGLLFAQGLWDGTFSLTPDVSFRERMEAIKTITEDTVRNSQAAEVAREVDRVRKMVNDTTPPARVSRFMCPKMQDKLDQHLYRLLATQHYQDKVFDHMDMSIIYQVNESDIDYTNNAQEK
jgi:predicted nucleotidyltransferase